MSIWIFFKLIGALALLMFGMKSMSDSLQKMAGPQLRHVLGTMTTNRLTGILTGTLITAAVQSSTATTVMTVSFVNAGDGKSTVSAGYERVCHVQGFPLLGLLRWLRCHVGY